MVGVKYDILKPVSACLESDFKFYRDFENGTYFFRCSKVMFCTRTYLALLAVARAVTPAHPTFVSNVGRIAAHY